jgi:hypothetical protein
MGSAMHMELSTDLRRLQLLLPASAVATPTTWKVKLISAIVEGEHDVKVFPSAWKRLNDVIDTEARGCRSSNALSALVQAPVATSIVPAGSHSVAGGCRPRPAGCAARNVCARRELAVDELQHQRRQ